MADARLAASRPLSPHLQVFRFILTMAMSIVHRITGGFLYVGTVFIAVWLVAAASGPEWFARVDGVYQSWIGRLILLGLVWSLIHHAIRGVRHFICDRGCGCCTDAIKAGVKRVFIINGTVPHAILIEMLTEEGLGTMFVGHYSIGK